MAEEAAEVEQEVIVRHKLPHALLLALSVEPMEPEKLRAHGKLFGRSHAVVVAIERLRERGLIECEMRITQKGRTFLRRSGE